MESAVYLDPWYLLIMAVSTVLGLASSSWVNRTFKKWSTVPTASGENGARIASEVLAAAGVTGVSVNLIPGLQLTDHYDPRTKALNLSSGVYEAATVAAAGVAAHEAGHAIQDAEAYFFGRVRSAIVPVANFGSKAAWPLVILGFWIGLTELVWVGILAYGAAVVFQVVTLPVEFDASRRAMAALTSARELPPEQLAGAREVLTAASFTYISATLISALQLAYLAGFARRD